MRSSELSPEEQSVAWKSIEEVQLKQHALFPLTNHTNKQMFTSLIVALVLAIGVGGTAVTADNAKPGDTLFGVDRAVENIRLNLASDEKKNELRIKFADERIKEIEDISSKDGASMERPAAAEIKESTVTEIEADVFTNETVIKIEYSDKKFVFTGESKTKAEVIDLINKEFPALSKAFIESKLDFEAEDRASRADDKKVIGTIASLSAEDKAKVSLGIESALDILASVSASVEGDAAAQLKLITDELNDYLDSLPDGARVRLDEDRFRITAGDDGEDDDRLDVKVDDDKDKARIDLRSEDGRLRIEIKNGEVEIKAKDDSDDDGDDDSDDESDDSDDDSDDDRPRTSSGASLEIEADIFTNETVVKVELNDKKTTFTTSADTRAEIIAAVKAKYPDLTEAQISAALEVETEDRSSLINDITGSIGGSDDDEDESEDSDDDSDDSKDDEDSDDDSSGKGSGKDDEDDDD